MNPFVFLRLDTTHASSSLCAKRWAAEHLGAVRETTRGGPKIRTRTASRSAIFPADFQEHATAHLIAELFPLHDRGRFRVTGYSYGRDDGSAARRELRESFDEFEDLLDCSHAESAIRIEAGGVDILVDLKGYTTDARPEILGFPAGAVASELSRLSGYDGKRRAGLHIGGSGGSPARRTAVLQREARAPSGLLPGERPPAADRSTRARAFRVRPAGSRRSYSAASVPSTKLRRQCSMSGCGSWRVCRKAYCGYSSPTHRPWRIFAARRNRGSPADPRGCVFAPSLPNPEHLARLARRSVSRHPSVQCPHARQRRTMGWMPGDHMHGPRLRGPCRGQPACGRRLPELVVTFPCGLRGPGVETCAGSGSSCGQPAASLQANRLQPRFSIAASSPGTWNRLTRPCGGCTWQANRRGPSPCLLLSRLWGGRPRLRGTSTSRSCSPGGLPGRTAHSLSAN